MGARVEPRVENRWQMFDSMPGDVELTTVWPGGSDTLSWTPGVPPAQRFRGAELVDGMFGPVPVFAGTLNEPDPSQDQISAQGAWHEGDGWPALDSGGAATAIPDVAVDQAILRGLRWTRPTSITSSAVDIDISQGPVTVGALLDSWSEQSSSRWGVNPLRQLYAKVDDTTFSYQSFPLSEGLGYALDNYASTLVGRYYNGATYATATQTDLVAESLHGHKEAIVDLTVRGTLTPAKANTILSNMLKLGRAIPQWTVAIQLAYGELLTPGGSPVALETVAAGSVFRAHGGFELAQRLNGALYVDILIGRTQLVDGLITLYPMELTGDTLADQLALAAAGARR